MKKVRCIGLDVHADTIAVAVAEPNGEVRSLGVIPNRPESIRKLVKKLGSCERLRVCYEAGPTGYVIYWQLTSLGVRCEVVAPTLVPVKAGDRVKTDRRDATKLARSYRAGDLTPLWVPDAAHEALRDLVRAREAAKKDQLRARHRLGKFLLRHGRRPATGMTPWTQRYLAWVRQAWARARTRAAPVRGVAGSPRPAMRICGALPSKRSGPIGIGRPSAARSGNARPPSVRRSRRSAGRRSSGCTRAIGSCWAGANVSSTS